MIIVIRFLPRQYPLLSISSVVQYHLYFKLIIKKDEWIKFSVTIWHWCMSEWMVTRHWLSWRLFNAQVDWTGSIHGRIGESVWFRLSIYRLSFMVLLCRPGTDAWDASFSLHFFVRTVIVVKNIKCGKLSDDHCCLAIPVEVTHYDH